MKRILLSLIVVLSMAVGIFAVPALASAADVGTQTCPAAAGGGANSPACVCDGTNGIEKSVICQKSADENPLIGPHGVLTTATSIIALIAGIVAVIIIVIAAIKFMTSQGNPQAITVARNQIIYAAIGLAVAGIAQGLVAFVLKKL